MEFAADLNLFTVRRSPPYDIILSATERSGNYFFPLSWRIDRIETNRNITAAFARPFKTRITNELMGKNPSSPSPPPPRSTAKRSVSRVRYLRRCPEQSRGLGYGRVRVPSVYTFVSKLTVKSGPDDNDNNTLAIPPYNNNNT